jgi:N-methylhydantoinase B
VLDDQGHANVEATEKQRAKLRKARLRKAPKRERRKVETAHGRRIAEGLVLVDRIIACSKCEKEICPAVENYKLHCAVTERPVKATNPYVLDPKTYVDDKIVFRSYACPSCGLLLQTEMARPTDPPLWDIQLAM